MPDAPKEKFPSNDSSRSFSSETVWCWEEQLWKPTRDSNIVTKWKESRFLIADLEDFPQVRNKLWQ